MHDHDEEMIALCVEVVALDAVRRREMYDAYLSSLDRPPARAAQ